MDKKEALKQIKAGELSLYDVDKKLQADKEIVLAAVKQDGSSLEYADKKLKADKEVVLAAVKQSGSALDYADKKLKADKEVVLAAVKDEYGYYTLKYADKKLKADKEVVLAAVKQVGSSLEYADKKLQADKEIVLTAVKQSGFALQYADKKLQADKEVVLIAVKQHESILQFADKKLKADKEVVLAAVKQYGLALQYADKKLQADKEVVLAAVKGSGYALRHADKKLQADKEVVLAAVKQDEGALNYVTKSLINDLKLNMIKIRVEGQGEQYYFQEISQETYNFYKDEGVLLRNAVSGNGDGDDIVGDLPTYYDEIDPLAGFQIGSSSLEITNYGGESQTIELSDANIKKLGINCKTKFVNMQDIINSKEGYVFLAYEEEVFGSNDSLPMLIEEEPFDLKKLRLTITNFAIEPDNSTQLITGFGYGNEKTDGLVPESIEGTEFELFRVLKKDKIAKKRKAKKKDVI